MIEEAPRLYLITPPIADAEAFAPQLEAALAAGDVACVYLRIAASDQATSKKIVRTLAPLAQARDTACLVDDPQIALRAGADGAHIEGLGDALEAAIASLKPDKIVGVGPIANRDDAMSVGETDVDYLMFGSESDTDDFAQHLDRVAWWAEIFNVPCVAYAPALADIAALAYAGADFIALGRAVWEDPRGSGPAVAEAAQMLALLPERTE